MENYQKYTDAQELGDFGRLLVDTSIRDAEGEIIEQGETVTVSIASEPRPRYDPSFAEGNVVVNYLVSEPKPVPKPVKTLTPKEEEEVSDAPAQMLTPEQIAQVKGEVSTDEAQTKGVILKSTTEPVVVEDKGLPMVAKVGIGLGLAIVGVATLYYIFKPSKVKTSQKPSEKTEEELEGIRKRKAAAKKKYALQGFVK